MPELILYSWFSYNKIERICTKKLESRLASVSTYKKIAKMAIYAKKIDFGFKIKLEK